MFYSDKRPTEVLPFVFDMLELIETRWLPAHIKSAGQYVVPPISNGFEYECTNAGKTAQDEPDWPTIIGVTVNDGSVEWTCRDYASNSVDAISTFTVLPPTGMELDSSSRVGADINATFSGGTVGNTYDVACRVVTAAGAAYVEILRITMI